MICGYLSMARLIGCATSVSAKKRSNASLARPICVVGHCGSSQTGYAKMGQPSSQMHGASRYVVAVSKIRITLFSKTSQPTPVQADPGGQA